MRSPMIDHDVLCIVCLRSASGNSGTLGPGRPTVISI